MMTSQMNPASLVSLRNKNFEDFEEQSHSYEMFTRIFKNNFSWELKYQLIEFAESFSNLYSSKITKLNCKKMISNLK